MICHQLRTSANHTPSPDISRPSDVAKGNKGKSGDKEKETEDENESEPSPVTVQLTANINLCPSDS